MTNMMTVDDAINLLSEFKKQSRLGGNTVLVLCETDREYTPIEFLKLDQDSDGAVVLCGIHEESF